MKERLKIVGQTVAESWHKAVFNLPAYPHISAVRKYAKGYTNSPHPPVTSLDDALRFGNVGATAAILRHSNYSRAEQRLLMKRVLHNRGIHLAKAGHALERLADTMYQRIQKSPKDASGRQQADRIHAQVQRMDERAAEIKVEYFSLKNEFEKLNKAKPPLVWDFLSTLPRDLPMHVRRALPHPVLIAYASSPNLADIDALFKGPKPEHGALSQTILLKSIGERTVTPSYAANVFRHEGASGARTAMIEALKQRTEQVMTGVFVAGMRERAMYPTSSTPISEVGKNTIQQQAAQMEIDSHNLAMLQQGIRRAKFYLMPDGTRVQSVPKRLTKAARMWFVGTAVGQAVKENVVVPWREYRKHRPIVVR